MDGLKRMRAKNRNGFTLIELLCAIGIIGILLGLVLTPLNRAWKKGQRLKQQVEASEQAMKQHAPRR